MWGVPARLSGAVVFVVAVALLAVCADVVLHLPGELRVRVLFDGPAHDDIVVLRETGDGGSVGNVDADHALEYATRVAEGLRSRGVHWRLQHRGVVNVYVDSLPSILYGPTRWDAESRSIHLGPGDATLDIIAHEAGHAVIAATSNLLPREDYLALNEAIADLIAVGFDGNWTLGEESSGVRRDHTAAVHVDDYVAVGAHHENSRIVSHAVYLAAERYGLGRKRAIDLVWDVLTKDLVATSGFGDFAAAMLERAGPAGSAPHVAMQHAFQDVGLSADWRAPSG